MLLNETPRDSLNQLVIGSEVAIDANKTWSFSGRHIAAPPVLPGQLNELTDCLPWHDRTYRQREIDDPRRPQPRVCVPSRSRLKGLTDLKRAPGNLRPVGLRAGNRQHKRRGIPVVFEENNRTGALRQ